MGRMSGGRLKFWESKRENTARGVRAIELPHSQRAQKGQSGRCSLCHQSTRPGTDLCRILLHHSTSCPVSHVTSLMSVTSLARMSPQNGQHRQPGCPVSASAHNSHRATHINENGLADGLVPEERLSLVFLSRFWISLMSGGHEPDTTKS